MVSTPVFSNPLKVKLAHSREQRYGRVAKGAGENQGVFTMALQKLSVLLPECCRFVICIRQHEAQNWRVAKMELYVNSTWTKCYGNAYVAEAIAWSESGNHATIYTLGVTAEEADAKLAGALRQLKLVPEASSAKGDSEVKTENPGP